MVLENEDLEEDSKLTEEEKQAKAIADFKKLEESVNYDDKTDSCTIIFDRPLKFGSEEHTEIIIKAPTWEDLDLIKFRGKGVDFDLQIIRKLAERMSTLDGPRLKKLTGTDIKKVMNAVMYFLQKSLA